MTKPTRDLSGDIYGRLRVIMATTIKQKGSGLKWVCLCECGNICIVPRSSLRSGNTRSCGCLKTQGKHKKSNTPEYRCLVDIRQRCYNTNDQYYESYGGRGITVCDRWMDKDNGFLNFLTDMGDRPTKNHSIDRINNDESYSPENCRWATKQQQTLNQRKRSGCSSPYKGVSLAKDGKWEANICYNTDTQKYLGRYFKETDAAKAYDEFARGLGYEEAWLNFPNEEI